MEHAIRLMVHGRGPGYPHGGIALIAETAVGMVAVLDAITEATKAPDCAFGIQYGDDVMIEIANAKSH